MENNSVHVAGGKPEADTSVHSATPWAEFRDHPENLNIVYVRSAVCTGYNGLEIAVMYGCEREPQQAENVKFLIRAVNAHDDLVKALKRMLDAFHEDPFENNTSGAVEQAYEALAKAST